MNTLYALTGLAATRAGREVLRITRLEIMRGGITALVGPNGAGKSTLLELMAFLRRPSAGVLEFDGAPVTWPVPTALQRRVGLVPQNPYLFDRSVIDNLLLGLHLHGVTGAEALSRATAVLQHLNLESYTHRHARELSGGEAQKVALARLVVLRPEVLLLDEPFSYLDAAARAEFATLIERFPAFGAQAVIFTGHDEQMALRLADRLVHVIDGEVAEGSLLNLFEGTLDPVRHVFATGPLHIQVADHCRAGTRLLLDPGHVVLSAKRLESSMQNNFAGRISSLREQAGEVLVTVEAGLSIHARVTHRALEAGDFRVGAEVWICFKSNAVRVF